jgi:hypothetical protein
MVTERSGPITFDVTLMVGIDIGTYATDGGGRYCDD